MRKYLLPFVMLAIFSVKSFGQNVFEKGYYIDNQGSKVEGLIKNMEWGRSPVQFEFKNDATSASKLKGISVVKEFEIEGKVKYVRADVEVEMSSDNLSTLSDSKDPIFTKKTVFLKALVEGKYTLYQYSYEDVRRFFYQTDSDIKPLVYKKYSISDTQVAKNNMFIEQMQSLSDCDDINDSQILSIQYRESDLKEFFIRFNTCKNENYKSFEKKSEKKSFHLSIRPGVNFSSLAISSNDNQSLYNTDFGNQTNFRVGVEAEFVMPFNNNKWALIIEPTYQYYNSEKEYTTKTILNEAVPNKTTLKYSSIEVPLGIRHYSFISAKSKVFVNASFVYDVVLGGSEITYEEYNYLPRKFKLEPNINFAFGIGYKYDNRYSLEFNYHTKRDILGKDIKSDYKTISLIFGYTLF